MNERCAQRIPVDLNSNLRVSRVSFANIRALRGYRRNHLYLLFAIIAAVSALSVGGASTARAQQTMSQPFSFDKDMPDASRGKQGIEHTALLRSDPAAGIELRRDHRHTPIRIAKNAGRRLSLKLTRVQKMQTITRRLAVLSFATAVLLPTKTWAAWPVITVHKDPTCDCCGGWIEHLKSAGFLTNVIETNEIDRVKIRLGVPNDLAACHTAEVGGYLIEGHVPASSIEKLLTERPKAKGLAVPGMPSGSPGMGGEPEEYEVILFGPERRVFARFKGEIQIWS